MAWRDEYGDQIKQLLMGAGTRGMLATELVPRILALTTRRSAWGARAAITRLYQNGLLAKRFEFESYRGNPLGKRTYRYWIRDLAQGIPGAVAEDTIKPRASAGKLVYVRGSGMEKPQWLTDLERRGTR